MTRTRRVLHVLPHPGGGGETYVDLLSAMDGYRFDRTYLAPSPRPQRALARGVLAALRAGRGCDLVHVEGEVAAGLCLPLLARRPSVVTLNGLHLLRRVSGLRRRAAVLNLRAVVRAAARTICVSKSEHATLVGAMGETRRAVVVRNGVHVRPLLHARADVRSELGLIESERVAIWIGGLDGHKDPLTAARAAARAGLPLLVVGDGPLRASLEMPGVRLVGRRDDVPRLLAAADVFVLTSKREGLSFALLEALAAGLPAVVSDLPENVEAIGDCGVAVAAGDVAGFAAALATVAVEPEHARERIATLFSAERMVEQTRALYDDVLNERQPRNRPRATAR